MKTDHEREMNQRFQHSYKKMAMNTVLLQKENLAINIHDRSITYLRNKCIQIGVKIK